MKLIIDALALKFNHFLLLLIIIGGAPFTVKAQVSYPYEFTYNGNPLVRNHGAADPDAHVWDNTVWVYCSQDHEKINGDTYKTMDGYHVFSSTDMVNWTDHGEILHSRDVDWGQEEGGHMWAPCAARKKDTDGKYTYYLYFPHKDKAHNWKIGVAISDKPQGPFTDIGNYIEGTSGIDPSVLVDDDGKAYMYFDHNKMARLKENMIEFAEEPIKIQYGPEEIMGNNKLSCSEGPFIHKRNGIYYYSYTNLKNKDYSGFYAMADNPYGPFEWKGPMAPDPQGAQDHHSMIELNGQWYYFYHIAIPNIPKNKKGQGRIACFDRLYYNEDGTIQMVVHTFGPTKVLTTEAPNGMITLDPPGGAYAKGTEVTLTVSGDLGYAFDSWSGDLSGSETMKKMIVDRDKSVKANFKTTDTYTLSLEAENGDVTLTPPGGEYNSGTLVYLKPLNDFSYDFSYWSGDIAGIEVPLRITMTKDKVVKANFIRVPTYTITTNSKNGIIVLDPAGEKYEKETEVKMTAKKDFGYSFKSWSGDYTGTENPISLIMNVDKNITANFEKSNEGIIVFATNCGGKSLRSDDGILYDDDKNFVGGGTFKGGSDEVEGSKDIKLFKTERVGGEFEYKIPLKNDSYDVTLLFAEIFFGNAGARVFNVEIENKKVLKNFDIVSEAGKDNVLKKTFPIELKDGELNISFTSEKNSAKISAIQVVKKQKGQ